MFLEIHKLIKIMIAERELKFVDTLFYPSEVWLDAIKHLNFVFDLSEESLDYIRMHTGFITGVAWFQHAHQPYRQWNSERLKNELPLIQRYEELTNGLPEKYAIEEPCNKSAINNLGVRYNNKLISNDVLRYQRCITNLYNSNVFEHLENEISHPVTVEIGAGYGGVAHQIASAILNKGTYIIVDLPEILFWSINFIRINNPDKKLWIYDAESFDLDEFKRSYKNYDYIFIPNYMSEILKVLESVDLYVNLLSFQEMSQQQVAFYLDLIQRNLNGVFYSENFSKHWMNTELTSKLHHLYEKCFVMHPRPEQYSSIECSNDPQELKTVWNLFPFIMCLNGQQNTVFKQVPLHTPYGIIG
ncbi:putative sugar O-methyltransferase [Catenovulum maritimum]|nr:putative sugar O-methyltransferase [Catenovulum maritimum]